MRGRFPPHVTSAWKETQQRGGFTLMLRLCGKKRNGEGETPCLSCLCGKKHNGEGVSPL